MVRFAAAALLVALPSVVASSGSLSFLTLNVAGIPESLQDNDVPGDKTNNTAMIGQYFAKYNYDVIHVQEDFNYHATLYANDDHPYRTATSGGIVFGSGLNTLSNLNWAQFSRTKWKQCDIGSGDCLTPKGFTFMRMAIAPGVSVDFYNLHADAGDTVGDISARAANLQQVADAIDANSAGQAVVVAGDTNARYTRQNDGIRILSTQSGLTDAWVKTVKGGIAPVEGSNALLCDNPSKTSACEIVDKVLYRSGSQVDLNARSFDYVGDQFLQPDGSILSDHNPILVNFTWSTK